MIFLFSSEKIITCYKRILNVMQSACLGFSPIMVDNYAAFFKLHVGGSASDSMMAPIYNAIHFNWLGPELLVSCLAHRGSTGVFLSAHRDLHRRAAN